MNTEVITCVYCGHQYPVDTPTHGPQVAALTEHIKVCERHPMRAMAIERDAFRAALVVLVGTDGRLELEGMELVMRSLPAPDEDKAAMIDAIHALLKYPRTV